MLTLRGITRRYGPELALDDVSLTVRPGEVVGLLGANGAGKSTLLRIAAGLLPPDRGGVELVGLDLWSNPVEAKRHLGYAAEEPRFYDEISADEYLAFVAAIRGLDPAAARTRATELFERIGLEGRTDEPIQHYSHGMRKKLSFVAAVLHRPRVLLCDEALEGLDARGAIEAKHELRSLAADGVAVLFSSHVTDTIERMCERVVLLHRRRVARVLQRTEWGGPEPGPSVLEQVFLAATDPVPAGDGAR